MTKETNKKRLVKDLDTGSVEAIQTQSIVVPIVIAVLATIFIIMLILLILFLTGVLRLNTNTVADLDNKIAEPVYVDGSSSNIDKPTDTPKDANPHNTVVNNVTCYDETHVQVEKLVFCLPDNFYEGGRAGDGAFVYNLVDDDGQANVKVYATESQQTPAQFINSLSPNLKITDQNYMANNMGWLRAEANNSILSFATKSGDYIYAVLYTVRIGSDDAREAWSMIPATITLTN